MAFSGNAANEILEETEFKIPREELIDMTALALEGSRNSDATTLRSAMYTRSFSSGDFIAILLWEKELDHLETEDLRGKVTGKRIDKERTKLRIYDYEDLWREGARDAKTLTAWALYEVLSR